MNATEVWLAEAEGWAAWAREGDDGFSQFRQLLPGAGQATLDLGCGEGRFARVLRTEGHRVTGVDISHELVELARAADPNGSYETADAEELPFDDEAFDLVVAFNVLSTGSAMPSNGPRGPGGRASTATGATRDHRSSSLLRKRAGGRSTSAAGRDGSPGI